MKTAMIFFRWLVLPVYKKADGFGFFFGFIQYRGYFTKKFRTIKLVQAI